MNGFLSSSSSSSGEAARGGDFGGVGVLVTKLGTMADVLGGCLNELDCNRLIDGDGDPEEVGTVGCGVGKRLRLPKVLAASKDVLGTCGGAGEDEVE
jgi:hypothetical protein